MLYTRAVRYVLLFERVAVIIEVRARAPGSHGMVWWALRGSDTRRLGIQR